MRLASPKWTGAIAISIAMLLFALPAFAQKSKVQNDSLGETVNGVSATAKLISDEMYEAVFDIPPQWLTDSGGQIEMLGVEVLMVGGCHQGGTCSDGMTSCTQDSDCGTYCGRWAIEVWKEPAGGPQAQSSCQIIDQTTFATSMPEHKPTGSTIFSMTQSVPALGFQVEGQTPNGNAFAQELLFSQINQNPNVTINPVMISDARIRVGLKAIDRICNLNGTQVQTQHFPVMVTDQDGVSARAQNFLYGNDNLLCTTPRHYVWEDFAPAFKTMPGDWAMRLLLRYGTAPGGEDMGTADMGTDMGSADMGIADMGIADMGIADMGASDMGSSDMGESDMGGFDDDFGSSGEEDDLGNGNGGDDTGTGATLAIESITPAEGPFGESVDVVILGDGFEPGAEVLIGAENIGVTETKVQRIKATVPDDIAIGEHDVIVTNPDGSSARLEKGYAVLDGDMPDMGTDSGAAPGGSVSGVEDGCGCDVASARRVSLFGVIALLIAAVASLWFRRRRRAEARARSRRGGNPRR